MSSYYDIVAVAFGVRCNEHTISDGSVCFSVENLGVGYTNSQLKIDIATLKSRGQSVILSIGGGAVNGIIIVNSDKTVANFVSTTCALLTQYGFQGIDIDLENGINEFYLAKAIRQVQQKCGGGASGATQGYNSNSFILTFAPAPDDLLTSTSPYVTLIHSLSDLTTIVNTQLYNSGPLINALGNTVDPGTLDYLVSITELPILAGILLPHQTGIGIPAVASSCDSYACGSLASPTVLVNACSCLISGKNCGAYIPLTHYTSLGGVMIWNIDDEMTAGDGLAKSISDAFNTTLK